MLKRFRWYQAGLYALILGVPLAQTAKAQEGSDIAFLATDLALLIAEASGGS